MIREFDLPVFKAFLERESLMYTWGWDGGEDRRRKFIERMADQITTAEVEPADFVRIQSISNIGLITSELVLTPKDYCSGYEIYCLLPPSPRGNVNISRRATGKRWHELLK